MSSPVLQLFRFHLDPKTPLHMPPYNKGNVVRGGFGSAFRLRDSRTVFVIVVVSKRPCNEPESYELRNVCLYAAVFQPF